MRELTVDGVDEIALVRLPSINLASQAYRGEAGDGSFLVDDVAAAQSFPSLKIVRLIEDASGSDKHLYRGRVISKGFARGGDIADDARQITVGTVDSNWDLRRLRVHQWPRPSETGRARVVALGAYILNGSSSTATNTRKRPSTVIDVTTYVPNTNTVTMPANLYDATDPLAVIDDCARAEGKSYFVFIDDDGDMFLWFDVGTSTSYASTLAISDDAWDFSTVFPPADDGQPGEEDGTELLSGAGLVDSTGTAYAQQDAGIEAANDVAEETIFDNGAGPVDATNRLTAFLDERELEELRYACGVQLRAEDAHLIKAGMTIAFRWAAAGVTSPVTLRVARCAPEHIEPDLYLLHLELGFPEKVSARIANHGRPTPSPNTGGPITDTFNRPDGYLIASTGTATSDSGYVWVSDPAAQMQIVDGRLHMFYNASSLEQTWLDITHGITPPFDCRLEFEITDTDITEMALDCPLSGAGQGGEVYLRPSANQVALAVSGESPTTNAFTFAAGTKYRLHWDWDGTTVRASIWLRDVAEPAWMWSFTAAAPVVLTGQARLFRLTYDETAQNGIFIFENLDIRGVNALTYNPNAGKIGGFISKTKWDID